MQSCEVTADFDIPVGAWKILQSLSAVGRNSVNKPLWRPRRKQQETANLARFMDQAGKCWSVALDDFETLYNWSIREPEKFWLTMWDFSGIIAETQGKQILVDGDKAYLVHGTYYIIIYIHSY